MSVCVNCQKASNNLLDSFTRLERLHLLSSAVAMARNIQNGPSQDKMVSSSVVTKLLLSFPNAEREALRQYCRQAIGMEITLGSCPHSVAVLDSANA